jgi:5-methylcytosine-specific restriction endonuclease McrA
VLKEIVKRDGGADCYYCGKPGHMRIDTGSKGKGQWMMIEHEIDHIIPLSKEGTNDADNLVIACKACNRKKSNNEGWNRGSQKND